MITVSNVSLAFGQQTLFKDVNIKFTPGNCYGVIGANGAGKSTFLRVLSGEIEPDTGEVSVTPGERVAVLQQDQFQFDEYTVMKTVIMGHQELYRVMTEREELYEKEEFSDEDGMRISELEGEFAELGGWEAESEAGRLLSGLGIDEGLHERKMGELAGGLKVRVLLAQALFGNPDIVLLDEPTNNLDLEAVNWLEEFLYDFDATVIVVSHDRHFLNKVCTHIADIDFGKIQLFAGNYDFWFHASQLARKQQREEKKRREEKIAELKSFIERFASNAAKSKQATSRQKEIQKLTIDDIQPSSRKAPYINFSPERQPGNKILKVEGLTKEAGESSVRNISFTVQQHDKIAFVGPHHHSKTQLFEILAGEEKQDFGSYEWGTTITPSFFPKENTSYFDSNMTILQWLQQYTDVDDVAYVRGFLGRMLFSGDEPLKKVNVLSGGERVRCMLSKLMLEKPNALVLDEPTNHLDLEAITALNDALIDFPGVILFTSHDHEFVQTIANRIIEITPSGIIDRYMSLDDYIVDERVRELRDTHYHGHALLEI
jgi:ATPase subunit of ABC transporter with duplicated ATPase domains